MNDGDELKGFSKEAAQALVGVSVIKRVLDEDNPAVVVGQTGKVIEAQESSITDGYAVLVDWGNRETWVYDLPEGFAADAEIVGQ